MPGFRYQLEHDVALATQVASDRPTKLSDWVEVAAKLSQEFSTEDNKVDLKGRGCRDHMELLLKKHSDEDKKALKKSGTEEEYSELAQLLDDIGVYMRDFATVKMDEKSKEKQKKDSERKQGEEMRQAALRGLKRAHSSNQSIDLADEEDDDSVESSSSSRRSSLSGPSTKRATKVAIVDMLQEKYERKASLKETELELKRIELGLQERRLALDEEERRTRLELEAARHKMDAEERRAILEMLKKKL